MDKTNSYIMGMVIVFIRARVNTIKYVFNYLYINFFWGWGLLK